jgi:hypothetical protein
MALTTLAVLGVFAARDIWFLTMSTLLVGGVLAVQYSEYDDEFPIVARSTTLRDFSFAFVIMMVVLWIALLIYYMIQAFCPNAMSGRTVGHSIKRGSGKSKDKKKRRGSEKSSRGKHNYGIAGDYPQY